MLKKRLDILMVERGLAESRSLAQRLVMAGQVRVVGQVALKPSQEVEQEALIEVERGPRYASRGGEKLAAALEAFKVDVSGKVCADVGASTGGFSDCLLQNGARRVYAIDVGKGQLHWKLRNDGRVVVMEDTNARFMTHLPEQVDIATIDVSFISLRLLLPVVKGWLAFPAEAEASAGQIIALVKPQFEAGRVLAARGAGVIREAQDHLQILGEVLGFSQAAGFAVSGLIRSPLLGPKGNVEFLAWLTLRLAEEPGRPSLEDLLNSLFG
jgi:23S rRNA (cytidine1920-2'-O)/16S rRNA (cytidine1409-2'-O)-methyltransferase